MVTWLPYLLVAGAGIVFYELLTRSRALGDIRRVFRVAPEAVDVIGSKRLSDEEKEKRVRRLALTVLLDTARFTAKLALVVAISAGLLWFGSVLISTAPDVMFELLLSWEVLIGLVILIALYTRLRPPPASSTGS